MQNCKAANMPKDNIERAIKKATDKDTSDYKEATSEDMAYGIAIFVETATDNNNRTVANVRSHFNRGRTAWHHRLGGIHVQPHVLLQCARHGHRPRRPDP